MQRVKDVERFLRELERPAPTAPGQPKTVTQAELEQDAASFMAFTKAFGVGPAKARASGNGEPAVPSRPA